MCLVCTRTALADIWVRLLGHVRIGCCQSGMSCVRVSHGLVLCMCVRVCLCPMSAFLKPSPGPCWPLTPCRCRCSLLRLPPRLRVRPIASAPSHGLPFPRCWLAGVTTALRLRLRLRPGPCVVLLHATRRAHALTRCVPLVSIGAALYVCVVASGGNGRAGRAPWCLVCALNIYSTSTSPTAAPINRNQRA